MTAPMTSAKDFDVAFGKVLARERSIFHLLDPRVAGRLLIPGAGSLGQHELA
jgi:hypothetical protein